MPRRINRQPVECSIIRKISISKKRKGNETKLSYPANTLETYILICISQLLRRIESFYLRLTRARDLFHIFYKICKTIILSTSTCKIATFVCGGAPPPLPPHHQRRRRRRRDEGVQLITAYSYFKMRL